MKMKGNVKVEEELLRKRKSISVSGKEIREEIKGGHSCDQNYIIYRYENVTMKPTIVYN